MATVPSSGTPPTLNTGAATARNKASPRQKLPSLGPLDPFLADPTVSEIMVNDTRSIIVEREGKMITTQAGFASNDEVYRAIGIICEVVGRVISPEIPYLDATLPDGSRVNIVIAPVTLTGPSITIRKFPARHLSASDLIARGMLDQKLAMFLGYSVQGRMNILISGGTGSGKTSLLGALLGFVPAHERVVTIEDTPELMLALPNSVRMQTKLHTPLSPAISARDLVANSLRMRPDRIIIGECRKGESLDMLQAMNTGHSGAMTTVHANSPRDALARIETLCMMSGVDVPLKAIRKQIASALDLLIHVKRLRSGKRRIVHVAEVTGMEGETITIQDLFLYEAENDRIQMTGMVPTFAERLRDSGIDLPKDFFA